MIKGIRIALCGLLLAATSSDALAQKFELLEYGKMDNWVVRNIKESAVIGGKKKTIYAIGPNMTINNNIFPNCGTCHDSVDRWYMPPDVIFSSIILKQYSLAGIWFP